MSGVRPVTLGCAEPYMTRSEPKKRGVHGTCGSFYYQCKSTYLGTHIANLEIDFSKSLLLSITMSFPARSSHSRRALLSLKSCPAIETTIGTGSRNSNASPHLLPVSFTTGSKINREQRIRLAGLRLVPFLRLHGYGSLRRENHACRDIIWHK